MPKPNTVWTQVPLAKPATAWTPPAKPASAWAAEVPSKPATVWALPTKPVAGPCDWTRADFILREHITNLLTDRCTDRYSLTYEWPYTTDQMHDTRTVWSPTP